MKKLSAALVALTFCLSSPAGELSEIDLVTRETLVEKFNTSYEDIWALDFGDPREGCLTVITGLMKIQSQQGPATFRFWVCITKGQNTFYVGEVIDHSLEKTL